MGHPSAQTWPLKTLNVIILSLELYLLPETASVAAPPTASPVAEDEDEDEQEVEEDDMPDLTSFTIDDMKQ